MVIPSENFQQSRSRGLLLGLGVLLLGSLIVGGIAVGPTLLSAIYPGRDLDVAGIAPLDAWIMPPDFTHEPPKIISTPAGQLYGDGSLVVVQGSTLSAHLAAKGGEAPVLTIDGKDTPFVADKGGDFSLSYVVTGGRSLTIRRQEDMLATWKIAVVEDNPPAISMSEAPSIIDNKMLRVSYVASDDFGITDVALRIVPHNPMPGADNGAVEIALSAAVAKQISRVELRDLTSMPWAGQPVTLQIVATNMSGKRSVSNEAEITLPERHFFHPIARVLIEERKKLMQDPDNYKLREEAANIMAGISLQTAQYHGDPVILMSLRAGALRLVLDGSHAAALSINNILWQSAARIEDGHTVITQPVLRDAKRDLA